MLEANGLRLGGATPNGKWESSAPQVGGGRKILDYGDSDLEFVQLWVWKSDYLLPLASAPPPREPRIVLDFYEGKEGAGSLVVAPQIGPRLELQLV